MFSQFGGRLNSHVLVSDLLKYLFLPEKMAPCLFTAYPWDKSSLKSIPLDLQKFEKLDAYASKVSLILTPPL